MALVWMSLMSTPHALNVNATGHRNGIFAEKVAYSTLSQHPYPRISKCHLCRLSGSISSHTNQPVARGAITDMKDALSIHIQINTAALSYDRKQIWLVQPSFDSRTDTSLQDIRGFAIKTIELIGPIYFDGVVVA